MAERLEIEGMTADQLYTQIRSTGLSHSDAAILVSGWIFENFGRTKRTFDYREPFAATDPGCAAKFQRSFQHTDWIDGESVVQAEKTVGEDGFNERFHNIEADLDALKQDLDQAFACMAEMRGSIRKLLDELKAEVNRLNADIFECCGHGGLTPFPGTVVEPMPNFGGLVSGGTFLGATKLGDKDVTVWKTAQGTMLLPAVHTIGVDAVTGGRVNRAGELAKLLAETREITTSFPAGQPITKKDLVTRHGAVVTSGGTPLRELVEILPEGASYRTLEELVEDVAEREAAALRTTSGASAAIASAFGLETEAESVATAPLDRMAGLPAKVRTALVKNGIDTVEKLSAADPRSLAQIMRREGVEVTAGEPAAWRMNARTLTRLGR